MAVDNDIPDEIYLQVHGDARPDELGEPFWPEVTWSREKVYEGDVKYVREDAPLTGWPWLLAVVLTILAHAFVLLVVLWLVIMMAGYVAEAGTALLALTL